MKLSFIAVLLGALTLPLTLATAGESSSNGGRGGLPDKLDEAALAQYISEGGLKMSMLHYLDTLQLSQVTGSAKSAFEFMMQNGALKKDIESPDNYQVGLQSCNVPGSRQDALAWTNTGKDNVANIGGTICFDVQRLVQQFKASGLGIEDAVIKVAALAFHEHYHHFQEASDLPAVIEQQEREANAVGGYVELTAKIAQVPLLKWSGQSSGPSRPENIRSLDYQMKYILGDWYAEHEKYVYRVERLTERMIVIRECDFEKYFSTHGECVTYGSPRTPKKFYNFWYEQEGAFCERQKLSCGQVTADPSGMRNFYPGKPAGSGYETWFARRMVF